MKKVLVAVDGSQRERGVIEAGVLFAKSAGAKLILLRVVGIPVAIPMEAFAMAPVDLERLLQDNAKADVERLLRDVPAELRGKALTATGTAWDCICRIARDENVDAIVIGSHGYGGIDRLLGTTAAKVVNHADRSVFVVRSPAPAT